MYIIPIIYYKPAAGRAAAHKRACLSACLQTTHIPPTAGICVYNTVRVQSSALGGVCSCCVIWKICSVDGQESLNYAPFSIHPNRPCSSTCCCVCSYFTRFSTWSGASALVPSGESHARARDRKEGLSPIITGSILMIIINSNKYSESKCQDSE